MLKSEWPLDVFIYSSSSLNVYRREHINAGMPQSILLLKSKKVKKIKFLFENVKSSPRAGQTGLGTMTKQYNNKKNEGSSL